MLRRTRLWLAPILALAVGLAITTAALGGGATATAGKVKVALILDTPKNDGGWSQAGYLGMKKLADRGLIDLTVQENVPDDPATTKRVVAGFAKSGFQLVVAHSFSYGKGMFEVAKSYPKVDFAWPGGLGKHGGLMKNVADYDQPFYQASYLAGILAGGVTKTGTIGGLGGFDIPVCHSMIQAFGAGAKLVKPSVKLLVAYTGDWIDVAKAQEATLAQASQGADVFNACGVDHGMFQAARQKNLAAVGYTQDQAFRAPKDTLASMLWNLDVTFGHMITDINAGKFQPGRFYQDGVRSGALSIKINPKFATPIPAKAMQIYKAKLAAIKNGTFKVPYVPSGK
jgi:basic membrane protein A